MTSLSTTLNGQPVTLEVEGPEAAVDVLRDQRSLTGTKLVCAGGVCGACTIGVDGEPVAGCLTPATALRDAEVTTVEGLADGDELHPVQRAFLAHDGLQCGFCTPGFVVGAAIFVDRWRAEHGDVEPDRPVIADALAGHLCRCGAYAGIYRAVAAACRGEHDTDSVVHRVDGRAKVTGQAVYTADVRPAGALEAVIVRSPIASGVVGPIPTAAAGWLIDLLDEDRRVRWAGQPILALAAETLIEARRLAAELELPIEPRPFVVDPAGAAAPDAPLVFESKEARSTAANAAEGPIMPARWSGNRRGPNPTPFLGTVATRRIARARTEGARGLVDLRVQTSTQLHTAFEPHCAVADFSDPGSLRLWVSTQNVDGLRQEVAEHVGLPVEAVEVIADYVGGGFGAKGGLSVEARAACDLSRRAGRPVRLVLDRREELTATGNRPGSSTGISLLVDDEGDLRAMTIDAEAHTGTSINGIYGVLGVLLYDRTPRVAYDADVVSNAPPGAPFRGPGGPTIAWAQEQAVDQVAHQLGRDPIALRRRWDGNERRRALYDRALGLPMWRDRPVTGSATGRYRRGVGFSAANWLYFFDPGTEVRVGIDHGRLVATTATQDIGTGVRTVVARAVAEVFGVDPLEVTVEIGRSGRDTPHGPGAGGSRSTASVYPAAVEAATTLRDEVGKDPAEAPHGASATARRGSESALRMLRLPASLGLQVGRGFSSAVHVVEVEVDTRTGTTRALRVDGGLGIGVPHARELAISQCEGSIVQGIGFALYENQVLDPHTGQTLTANLEDYRIPQLGDTPEMTIHFHEPGWEHVPGGGVGLGEVATISVGAAVANAVFNATGWRPTTSPIRPDRLLEGLR